MIFSSYFFLFAFLPIAVGGYLLLRRFSAGRMAIAWMVIASLAFYAWKTPPHLVLLLGSVAVNYGLGLVLGSTRCGDRLRWWMLATGVTFNLSLICAFKYFEFVWDLFVAAGGPRAGIEIVLPIGISFFTFQQIAYLVDVFRDRQACRRLLDYLFFVSFFPQLIAGPIVHHREILPQLAERSRPTTSARDFSVGGTMLVFGLFKKVVLADQFALYATPIFSLAEQGRDVSWLAAWIAALAFSLQLYFDFSGYSDMAIGLARLIGIRLPANFDSPYRATSVIEFWHRWHMTLSRFLRDYLYFAIGGNRHGRFRRYVNLMITMLLGGLWHGASWTFVVWGGFHGVMLCLNHFSRWAIGEQRATKLATNIGIRVVSTALTFGLVTVGWVLFRAETFAGATRMLSAMGGVDGFGLACAAFSRRQAGGWILVGLAIVWVLPNTQTILRRYRPALVDERSRRTGLAPLSTMEFQWRPTLAWAIVIVAMAVSAIVLLDRPSAFIYYQF